jgi:hypothetical protein
MRSALFSYVKGRGVLCYRVGGRPDDPCSDPAIMVFTYVGLSDLMRLVFP